MRMNHLLRALAPISDSGWELLDREARVRLRTALAARKLVDFSGPHGWEHSASNLGHTVPLASAPCEGVSATQRLVLPLVELRADFEVSLAELRDADRGAGDPDLAELDRAAHRIAVAENTAVFHGFKAASIKGIVKSSPHDPVKLGGAPDAYPGPIAGAVQRLLESGIEGPYALALGGEEYQHVVQSTEHGGYPLLDHLRKILDGPIVWAPGVKGGVVLSRRGGDFIFDAGQDLSIGYDRHDDRVVVLYLEGSFSSRVMTPEAAVALTVS
jgi:uncharacterized linocin/CFP29 family protein